MSRTRMFLAATFALPLMLTALLTSAPVATSTPSASSGSAKPLLAAANVPVTQVSSDPYTDSQAQHRTEVEPDTFTFGNTIVSAFQVGRVHGGGASNIGFARSTDGGANWTHGYVPGITRNEAGPCGQASDPSVAFDARHNVWLISSLALNCPGRRVFTSRSTDGGLTWSNPITTASGSVDKNWIVCDNHPTSPFFGNCYTQYDITSSGSLMRMRTSTDGGLSWGTPRSTSDSARGLGGQPIVRPNGTVLVPFRSSGGSIRSFRSINGGSSWRASVLVSNVRHHTVAGGLRAPHTLPSAEIDANGTAYVAWSDCRFRTTCASNDIVISKSTSETTWAAPLRVPIDAGNSTVDHFVPGIGVDPSTSGATARIGLTYYYYPNANCTSATCQLFAGFISSTDGGSTWSSATEVAGPMNLSWLPTTSKGRMFGDYISTSVPPGGNAFSVIPIASTPEGTTFDMAMFVPIGGLPITGGAAS
ncbi:sialidase family protein [Streptomyces xiangluensis]|uniref:Sialidase family protein n=1 Tax=Streptomyces xiangluensis TaxID=2665720 RepID=A0ABV8Z364_9ACTN